MTVFEAAKYFYKAGFRGAGLIIITAIAGAESGYKANATNTAGNAHGTDVGLAQINTYWHPQYDYQKLFDPQYNANAAYAISKQGTYFKPWVTFNIKAHVKYLKGATAAVSKIKLQAFITVVIIAIAAYFIYKKIK